MMHPQHTALSRPRLLLLILALAALGMAACSSGGGSGGGGEPFVGPEVTEVDPPEDSTGAVVTTEVTATFDSDMDAATINTSTFTLVDNSSTPVPLTSVLYDAATRTATLTPADDLEADNRHTATLTTDIQDTSGESLERDFVWRFTASSMIRASLDADGIEADGPSLNADTSESGRYIAFESRSTNLASGTPAGTFQVYWKDTHTGELRLVSADASGVSGDGNSFAPSISRDGRFVAFYSESSSFGASTANPQVFLKDLDTDALTLVSADNSGTAGSGASTEPAIAVDGSDTVFVAFQSTASNLDPSAGTSTPQIFLKNTDTDVLTLVSADGSGTAGSGASTEPSLAVDGSDTMLVAFQSTASDLDPSAGASTPQILLKNTDTDVLTLVSANDSGTAGTGASTVASLAVDSSDTALVAFQSTSTNFGAGASTPQIFLKDTDTATLTLVSADGSGTTGSGASTAPAIGIDDSDTPFVAFQSTSINFGASASNPQIFFKDTAGGTLTLISADINGDAGSGGTSDAPATSADARYVVFDSNVTNLVVDDTNLQRDVFRRLGQP